MITKQDCNGCRNDFYNGQNPLGVKECWSFKDAKLVSKLDVHINQMPPYHQKPTKKPNCYKADRFVRVDTTTLTKEGFWK